MSMPMGAINETSMLVEMVETSMSIEMSMSMWMGADLSMMSMLKGSVEMLTSPSDDPSIMTSDLPTQSPTLLPTYSPINDVTESPPSSLSYDLGIMPSTPPTQAPTESPVTSSPTTSSPVETDVELSDASVSITNIPSKLSTKFSTLFPSKLATKSPTLAPMTNDPIPIPVEANTQFQLIGMDAEMDVQASSLFKESCASFLMGKLANAQITCEVTNQRLLSQRRLQAGRDLQGESSLLVNVTVAVWCTPMWAKMLHT
jgi:hypothetical protein